MKKNKRILKGFILTISLVLLLIIIDYIRINIRYYLDKKQYEESVPIKGVRDGYAPQGLAFSEEYNVVLETSYKKNDVSKLYVIDFNTDIVLKELELYLENGLQNMTHVGGIAVDKERVWITGDGMISEYSLFSIMNPIESKIKSTRDDKIPIRGDFCYYSNNTLWIGDFYLKPLYNVPNDNPLAYAYDTTKLLNYDNPKLAIQVPKMVQGMSITKDNEFLFTTSYTNLINSNLYKYKDITKGRKKKIKIKEKYIPYYEISNNDLISTKKLPPMAEGMFYYDGYAFIIFENNSSKYFFAYPKVRNVLKYMIK